MQIWVVRVFLEPIQKYSLPRSSAEKSAANAYNRELFVCYVARIQGVDYARVNQT